MSKDIQDFFQSNKYVVIRNFLTYDMSLFFYQYCKNKVLSTDYKATFDKEYYNPDWDGRFTDNQINGNTYNSYGDVVFDTLNMLSLNKVQEFTAEELIHTYSFWRLYKNKDVLERHIDRESCEISTTLCLGYDNGTLLNDDDYCWPICLNKNGQEVSIELKPGDMLIYQGTEVEHWRDSFEGVNHAQVFLHYNRKNGRFNNLNDGRPILGIPKGDI